MAQLYSRKHINKILYRLPQVQKKREHFFQRMYRNMKLFFWKMRPKNWFTELNDIHISLEEFMPIKRKYTAKSKKAA
jgi:hypothetical protein